MQEGWSPSQGESHHIEEEIGLVSAWTGILMESMDIIYTYRYLLKFGHLNFQLNLIPHISELRAGA